MIDLFIKIVDRIIQLLKIRSDREKSIFENIYEPIFQDLINVHKNYLAMFEDTYQILLHDNLDWEKSEATKSALNQIISKLAKDRTEYEPVRIKVWSALHELENNSKSDQAKEYVLCLHNYFPNCQPLDPYVRVTDALAFLNYMKFMVSEDKINREEIVHYIESTLDRIRNRWKDVASAYATLRAHIYSM